MTSSEQEDAPGHSPLIACTSDESLEEPALLGRLFCAVLGTRYNVLDVKDYRLRLRALPGVPITPCLDHEAQIHEHALPHLGTWVQNRETGRLVGVVYFPIPRRIVVEQEADDCEQELEEIAGFLRQRFPEHEVKVERLRRGSAFVRARDVAEAHVPLVDVLTNADVSGLSGSLDQLNGISTLMEKESRVTSWGMRTAYAPLMAAIAFLLVLAFPSGARSLADFGFGDWARVLCLLAIGGAFLYYGLKAVQLTKTATRLNKRIQEYRFVLAARAALTAAPPAGLEPGPPAGPTGPVLSLLAEAADPARAVAWYVTHRFYSACVALGHDIESRHRLLLAICDHRRASADHQAEATEAAIAALGADRTSPSVVAQRARLSARLKTLRAKAERFAAYLAGPPEPEATEEEG